MIFILKVLFVLGEIETFIFAVFHLYLLLTSNIYTDVHIWTKAHMCCLYYNTNIMQIAFMVAEIRPF